MQYNYPKSIKEAAQILDQAHKDWFKRIDVSILDMTKGTVCILGQLYGGGCKRGYYEGISKLFSDKNIHDVDRILWAGDRIFGMNASKLDWVNEIYSRLNNTKMSKPTITVSSPSKLFISEIEPNTYYQLLNPMDEWEDGDILCKVTNGIFNLTDHSWKAREDYEDLNVQVKKLQPGQTITIQL